MKLTHKNKKLMNAYREMHQAGHFQGLSCLNFHRSIRALVTSTESRVVLDYGCGKGRQFSLTPAALHAKLGVYVESWTEALGVETVVGYDPCWYAYQDIPPGPFDMVYCTSVLEHVEEDDIPQVLQEVFSLAHHAVFIAVGTEPAKKDLPKGGNAHVTIRPIEWWITQVDQVAQRNKQIVWTIEAEQEKHAW